SRVGKRPCNPVVHSFRPGDMRHTKWLNAIAGSAVLAMVLAGCGGGDSARPAAGGWAENGTSAPAEPPSGKPKDQSANQPDQKPGADGQERPNVGQPPKSAEPVAGKPAEARNLPQRPPTKVLLKATALARTAQESGCDKATAELGKQSASQVEVTVVITQPKQPRMCTMDIRYPVLTVELDKPLADRTV